MSVVNRASDTLSEAQRRLQPRPGLSPAQNRERRHQALSELKALRELLEGELTKNPKNSGAQGQLGQCLVLLEDFPAAIPLLEQRAAALPSDPVTGYYLALAYEGAGRGADALAEMERVMTLGTPLAAYFDWMIERHRSAGDTAGALRWAERYAAEADGSYQGRARKLLEEIRSQRPEAPASEAGPSAP